MTHDKRLEEIRAKCHAFKHWHQVNRENNNDYDETMGPDMEYLLSVIEKQQRMLDRAMGAVRFCEMAIEHAISLGYVGEGSTNGMFQDALIKCKDPERMEREDEKSNQ